MCGALSAIFSTTPVTAAVSVESFFRNLRRAGTFAKSSSTITVVPSAHPVSSRLSISPASDMSLAPRGASFVFDTIVSFEPAAVAASASPRKPSVNICARSDAAEILLVA